MQVIVFKKLGQQPFRFEWGWQQWSVAALATLTLIIVSMCLGMWLSATQGSKIPVIADIERARLLDEQVALQSGTGPLDAMAIRLADMNAQLARLDAITARLLKTTGQPVSNTPDTAGQGGLAPAGQPAYRFSELKRLQDSTSRHLERQTDVLALLDADLQRAKVNNETRPSETPLNQAVSVSQFGRRIDPITGRRSFHEGVDFMAPIGTPILAAASGVVVKAGWHPAYGNTVDIEHGNNTTTRYAHASKILVREGQQVQLGQRIALVGNTGRSTGPHLHFEVRVNDSAVDPHAFLTEQEKTAPGQATFAALSGLLAESR